MLESLGHLLGNSGLVCGQVNGGIDVIGAVDVDQVIDAINPVEKLSGGGLAGIEVLGARSKARRVDALGIKKKSCCVEVALGLANASGTKDGLKGGFELKAVRKRSKHCSGGEVVGHLWPCTNYACVEAWCQAPIRRESSNCLAEAGAGVDHPAPGGAQMSDALN